ncbi:MAG: hypothetical protein K5891_10960 [Lachnospiraceae bacterium]|nr:hypothetical protein [Lachnospiraceae bacterium]
MKYPFFASFIIFIFVLTHGIRRNRRLRDKAEQDFWEREEQANATRRKPLDDLVYVRIPLEELPVEVLSDTEEVQGFVQVLKALSGDRIVNLTGYTNTDLKLRYGAPNLPDLSRMDENFTLLVQTLEKWAGFLWEQGETEASVRVMEYEISIRADDGSAYRRLARYYRDRGQDYRIEELVNAAQELRSLSKNAILRSLSEIREG